MQIGQRRYTHLGHGYNYALLQYIIEFNIFRLTSLATTKRLDSGWRAILAEEHVIGGERNQFAQLKANARLVEPSIAGGTQQFDGIQVAILATV